VGEFRKKLPQSDPKTTWTARQQPWTFGKRAFILLILSTWYPECRRYNFVCGLPKHVDLRSRIRTLAS